MKRGGYIWAIIALILCARVNVFAEAPECNHAYTEIRDMKAAVSSADGVAEDGYTGDVYCVDCQQLVEAGEVIHAAKRISISSVTYTGKQLKPVVTLYDTAGEIIQPNDYSVRYQNNKKIGNGNVTIILKGRYRGSLKSKFAILPPGTGINQLLPKRRGFAISWKPSKVKISGYQIEYSLKKNFSSAKRKKISSAKIINTFTGLKAKKKYYVRIRTYKQVGKETFYSKWSRIKSVITCKYLIVIDPGHQRVQNSSQEPIGPGASITKPKVAGGTSGVVSGLAEYQLTLKVSLKLEKELQKRGYEVVLVRRKHDVNIPNSQRAKMANELKADAFIRLHANGALSSSVNGAQTICMTSRNPYNKYLYKKSYKLSKCVLDAFVKKTGCRREFVSQVDNMSGINWSKVPVTILEMGYMTNPTEDRKMASDAYQKKMVIGISNGLDVYFKNKH